MPTSDYSRVQRDWWSRTISPSGQLILEEFTNNKRLSRERFSRPDTVRRKRPVDLFANSTDRSMYSDSYVLVSETERFMGYSGSNLRFQKYPCGGSLESPMFYGGSYGLYPYSTTNFGSLENKLLNDIKDQKVNLSVSMVELPKTADLVTDLSMDVIKTFRSLRSGRPLAELARALEGKPLGSVRGSSKKFADRWLQYQYGITPTMMEIYGATDLMNQSVIKGFPIMMKVSRTEYSKSTAAISRAIAGWTRSQFNDTLSRRIVCRYTVANQGVRTLAQTGISNPALLAWELVPYSFVVDWFLAIGDSLSALDALVGISNLRVIKQSKFHRTEFLSHNEPNQANPGIMLKPGLMSHTYRKLDRVVGSSLTPRLPSYEPHASIKRMASAAALLRNLFK